MPATITPVNAWTTPLQGPANGDAVDGGAGAIYFDMGQWLSNRIEYLRQRSLGTDQDTLRVGPHALRNLSSRFAFQSGTGAPIAWNQSDVTDAGLLAFKLTLPKRGTITSVTAYVKGAAGHAGLPGTMPALALLSQDIAGIGNGTAEGAQSDTSGSTGAYQAAHTITISGLSIAFLHDDLVDYYVHFTGEDGANKLTGLLLSGIVVAVDP